MLGLKASFCPCWGRMLLAGTRGILGGICACMAFPRPHVWWWLILCVSVICYGVPRLNIILGVPRRIFPDKISIWISGLYKAACPLQNEWASSNPELQRQKKEEFVSFNLSHCWDILSLFLQSLDKNLHYQFPWFSGLWAQTELHFPKLQLADWKSWDFSAPISKGANSSL